MTSGMTSTWPCRHERGTSPGLDGHHHTSRLTWRRTPSKIGSYSGMIWRIVWRCRQTPTDHQSSWHNCSHWEVNLISGQNVCASWDGFYFLVADSNQHDGGHQGEEIQTLSSEDDDEMLLLSFSEHLPVNWHVQCLHGDFWVPGAFLVGVINWFCAVESLPGTTRHFSELELVFALALDSEFCFPFQLDGTLGFAIRQPRTLFQRPTLAQLLRPVQKALKGISSLFPHLISRTPPEPAEQLGVYMRFPGIRFKCPDTIWRESRSYLLRHTSSRPIRLARDLARPLLWPWTSLRLHCFAVRAARKMSAVYIQWASNRNRNVLQSLLWCFFVAPSFCSTGWSRGQDYFLLIMSMS